MGNRAPRATRRTRHRGPALERLILNTTVLVTAERSATALDGAIEDEDDVSIAAITAAGLLVGVELSEGKSRQRRRAFVQDVLKTIPIETYDLDVARAHASLLAHTRRSGRPRGAHDLLIAATALTHGRTIVSADPSGFVDLPGLALRHFA